MFLKTPAEKPGMTADPTVEGVVSERADDPTAGDVRLGIFFGR